MVLSYTILRRFLGFVLAASILCVSGTVHAQTVPGDLDESSSVNAVDVQLVINGVLGIDIAPIDPDVNSDLQTNAVDVQLVVNGALGLDIGLSASFSVGKSSGSTPLLVTFSDTSTTWEGDPILTWYWTFDDGGTSNEPAPTHQYVVPGSYEPSLTLTTVSGQSKTVAYDGTIEVASGIDTDQDGISDADEILLGTNSALWDTDGDSFSDGDELAASTDPLTPSATLADGTLALDGVEGLEILGMDGDKLILFHRGGQTKALLFFEGMTIVTTSSIPQVIVQKGQKSFFGDVWGLVGDVTGVIVDTVNVGSTIVVDGVTYVAEVLDGGVVYVVQFVTQPIVNVFPNFDESFSGRISFNSNDPSLFPGGSPLRGRVIYNNNGVVVRITDGVITFSPDIYARVKISGGELTDATFKAEGSFFISLDLEATASGSSSITTGDIPLARASIPIPYTPLLADLELNGELQANFNGSATATGGFHSRTTIRVGGRYYLDDMHNLSSIQLNNRIHTPTLELQGDASVTLLVKPKLDINLYGQAGAYLEIRPFAQVKGYYPCPPLPTFLVGVDAEVGVYTHIFGLLETNPSITWPNSPLTYNVWKASACGILGTPPAANFSATPVSGASPLTVRFTDQSTPGSAAYNSARYWNFGDGSTSRSNNPTHTYYSSRAHTVTLTVQSDSGTDTRTRADYIQVEGAIPTDTWARVYDYQIHDFGITAITRTTDSGFLLAAAGIDETLRLIKTDRLGHEIWRSGSINEGVNHVALAAQSNDGNYILAASGIDISNQHIVLKVDPFGEVIWRKNLEAAILLGGLYDSQSGQILVTGSGSNDDMYLSSISEDGEMLWQKSYDLGRPAIGTSIERTRDGGYVVVGAEGLDKPFNVYVVKTDSSGAMLWQRTYSAINSKDIYHTVSEDAQGSLYVTGSSDLNDSGHSNVLIAKLSSSGTLLWMREFGGGEFDAGADILTIDANGCLVVGASRSFGAGDTNLYLLRVDTNGEMVWQRVFGGPESEHGHRILKGGDSGFILLGDTSSFGEREDALYLLRVTDEGYGVSTPGN